MTVRAIVIGAGWAGEGHTKALRQAGVEVAALCGRTPEPARHGAEVRRRHCTPGLAGSVAGDGLGRGSVC